MFLNNSHKFSYHSFGRDVLYNVLEKIQIKKNDLILLPEIICDVLLPTFYKFSENIKYYKVDRKLNPLNIFELDQAKVILLINYFGFPQDIVQLCSFCTENGITLIEDNAHGLYSKDVNGNYLGTRADFGIFSYRKTFFLPDGALLYSKDFLFNSDKSNQFSKSVKIKFYIKLLIINFSKKINFNLLVYLRLVISKFRFWASSNDSNFEYHFEKINKPTEYSFVFFQNVNESFEYLRRRNLFIEFEKKLKAFNIEPVFDCLPDNVCPYGYPFYVDDVQELNKIIKLANKCGFECVYWPQLPKESNISFGDMISGKIFFINFTFQ